METSRGCSNPLYLRNASVMKLQRNRAASFAHPVDGISPRKRAASKSVKPIKNPGGQKGLAKGVSNYQRAKKR